jgi:hypothetical protein
MQTECVQEQGAKGDIWTQERLIDKGKFLPVYNYL